MYYFFVKTKQGTFFREQVFVAWEHWTWKPLIGPCYVWPQRWAGHPLRDHVDVSLYIHVALPRAPEGRIVMVIVMISTLQTMRVTASSLFWQWFTLFPCCYECAGKPCLVSSLPCRLRSLPRKPRRDWKSMAPLFMSEAPKKTHQGHATTNQCLPRVPRLVWRLKIEDMVLKVCFCDKRCDYMFFSFCNITFYCTCIFTFCFALLFRLGMLGIGPVYKEWACSKMYYEQSPCRSQVPRPKPFGWRGVVALFTLGSSLQQWGMSQTWVVETALTESQLKLLILILSCCKKKANTFEIFRFFFCKRDLHGVKIQDFHRFSALQVRFLACFGEKQCVWISQLHQSYAGNRLSRS